MIIINLVTLYLVISPIVPVVIDEAFIIDSSSNSTDVIHIKAI